MSLWIIWLIVACVATIIELHHGALYLLPFAIGAALAAGISGLGLGVTLSVVAFLGGSGAAFFGLRPIALRHRHVPPRLRTGTAALMGQKGTVLEEVTGVQGSIKLDNGDVWTARTYDTDEVIGVGERAEVATISGATALVMR